MHFTHWIWQPFPVLLKVVKGWDYFIKKEKKKDFIFHMRILNDIYTWKEKYPAYAHLEDPL